MVPTANAYRVFISPIIVLSLHHCHFLCAHIHPSTTHLGCRGTLPWRGLQTRMLSATAPPTGRASACSRTQRSSAGSTSTSRCGARSRRSNW